MQYRVRVTPLAISNLNPRDTENAKKSICEVFKTYNLSITIEANLSRVDFLDVTLDLTAGLHEPYLKPNNNIQYVHTASNHPKHVIENIPKGVEKRLSLLSSNEEIFKKAIPPYQEALRKAGHKYQLKFIPPTQLSQSSKRKRARRVIWFTPPFSKTVKTPIGKKFLQILDTCFPPSNPLHKVFNRHTVKVSWSCMPNFSKLLAGHNKKAMTDKQQEDRKCSCRVPANCPVSNECLVKDVIYQAEVKRLDTGKVETYIGLTSRTFKERWSCHKTSFNLRSHASETSLSTYIWDLKKAGVNYELEWRIISKTKSYHPSPQKCWLCLKEKFYILYRGEMASLNKSNEFFTACQHKTKFKFCSQK